MGCTIFTNERVNVLRLGAVEAGQVVFYPEEESEIEAQLLLLGEWHVVLSDEPKTLRVYERYVMWEGLNIPFESTSAAALLQVNANAETTISFHLNVYHPDTQSEAFPNRRGLSEIVELKGKVEDGAIVGGLEGLFQRSYEFPCEVSAVFLQFLDDGYVSTSNPVRKPDDIRLNSGIKVYGSGATDTECHMCFEDYDFDGSSGADAIITPCGHVWCRRCIVAVLELKPPTNQGNCPSCQQMVTFQGLRRRDNHYQI